MRSFTAMGVFGLAAAWAGVAGSAAWAEDKPVSGPKGGLTPFVEVGPTVQLYSGPQLNPCQCTTLTGHGMREVRVGLVLVRDGEQTVVEERSYKWDAWPTRPPAGGKAAPAAVRVQGILLIQLHKGEARDRFSLAFGAGFEGDARWGHVQKPRPVVLETDLATTQYTSLRGAKAAGQVHVASIYAIHGADKRDLGDVQSVEDLMRRSKEHRGTTYLVTTLHWVAGN